MNYVVLYVDLEFIVGAVCTDNGNSYPITNGNDELLYLYFYNDPHSNKITFGRSNRDNAKKEVNNYYGKFFDILIDGHTKFKKGEFQKDAIELLQYSDLLKTIKDKYADVTKEKTEVISTLIVFSLSISDLAKQKTIEYLKVRGFQIDSYTIPIAELAGFYPYSKKNFLPANGSTIILLTATNSALYIMKLVYSDNYFMLDGEVKKYEGMGIDPRKRALVGYVINQININVGALSQNEISAEIEKKEFKADEWLKKIDAKAKNDNSPICITDSLSLMPSSIKQVLVKKSDIETFTNDFVNLLMDYFNAYRNDYISSDVEGIFLLGDCFNNSLVRQRFNNLFKDDDERKKKLFVYTNKDIQNILSVYPKIDFRRYINEEERSKAKAEAEERKIAEQRAIDNAKEAEAKAELGRITIEKKLEEIRKEAETLYGRATELDKEGKLQDALTNVENAVSLDKENAEYKRFAEVIIKKIKELNDKTNKYKSWYKDAENFEESGELDLALKAFKNAQGIFDSAELRRKIVKLESDIEKRAIEIKANSFIEIALALADKGKFEDAITNINKALEIYPDNINAKQALSDIFAKQASREIEKKYKAIITEAEKYFNESSFDNAIEEYKKANSLKPGDKYSDQQIDKIEKILEENRNKEKGLKIATIADDYFNKELWIDAKSKYEEALAICPNDNYVLDRVSKINKLLKKIEDNFNDLLGDAIIAEAKGTKEKLKEAIDLLNKAANLKPENIEIKARIKKINNLLKIGDLGVSKPDNKGSIKIVDDDFLGLGNKTRTQNVVEKSEDEEFLNTSQEIDDFLGLGKNTQTRNVVEKSNSEEFLNNSKRVDDFLFEKESKSEKQKKDFNW